MALNARKIKTEGKAGTTQEPIEAGTYPVRVAQIIDLGLQKQRPYKGQEKAPANEIMITYEFVDVFMLDEDGNDDEDKPRWLSEQIPLYSLEVDRAKSTKRYEALDPNEEHEGDFTQLVGAAGMLTVVNNKGKGDHAGKVFTNVASLSVMRDRDIKRTPELVNPPKVFDLDNPDMEVFGSLPDWLQDKIKGNLEFNGSKLAAALDGEDYEEPEDGEEESDDDWN